MNRYILFIVNDFNSHMTYEFFDLIDVNYIVFFKLSIHFTNCIQSLNIDVFQSYKNAHVVIINKIIRNDDDKFNRMKFLIVFQNFRDVAVIIKTHKNFKNQTIQTIKLM